MINSEELEWASANIGKDSEEESKLYANILDHLKSYVNPEMYSEELKFRKLEESSELSGKLTNSDEFYKDKLLRKGAKIEEVE